MPTSRRREILGAFAGSSVPNMRWRVRLMKAAGVETDRHLQVLSGLRISGEGRIRLGNNCYINHDCLIDAAADVTIGDEVSFGYRVSLITSGHDYDEPRSRAGARLLEPIVIEDGAWLGAGVIVLGGVTVGAGAVIGAGSVVLTDVPAHTLWAGVPARQIRELPQ